MNADKLAAILEQFYNFQPKGEKAISMQIFGIYFADKIESPKEIIEKTKLPKTYVTEINKGKKLSKYVTITNKKVITKLEELIRQK